MIIKLDSKYHFRNWLQAEGLHKIDKHAFNLFYSPQVQLNGEDDTATILLMFWDLMIGQRIRTIHIIWSWEFYEQL